MKNSKLFIGMNHLKKYWTLYAGYLTYAVVTTIIFWEACQNAALD